MTPVKSLQSELVLRLCTLFLVLALLLGAISFLFSLAEVHENYDAWMKEAAAIYSVSELDPENLDSALHAQALEFENTLIVKVTEPDGRAWTAGLVTDFVFPEDLTDGIQDVASGGDSWRVYVYQAPNGRRVSVASVYEEREEALISGLLAAVLPVFILLPLLYYAIRFIVGRVIGRVDLVSRRLRQVSIDELEPLPLDAAFAEITPFIRSINQMIVRIRQGHAIQKKFVSDAAHELKTPAASALLRLEQLLAMDLSDDLRRELGALKQSVSRQSGLVSQLLSMARAQGMPLSSERPVLVGDILRSCIGSFVPLMDKKSIRLDVIGEDVRAIAPEMELSIMLGNLIDNAIKYSPDGGSIQIRAWSDENRTMIQVADAGEGVPAEAQDRLFDPFYRAPGNQQEGSGMGLSIVKSLAERCDIGIRLDSSPFGKGFAVTLVLKRG